MAPIAARGSGVTTATVLLDGRGVVLHIDAFTGGRRSACIAHQAADCLDGERPEDVRILTDRREWVCSTCARELAPALEARRAALEQRATELAERVGLRQRRVRRHPRSRPRPSGH